MAPQVLRGAAFVSVATGCPGLDAAIHSLAKEAGATVNVVDRPDPCDAITPSIVDRSPVVVATGTEDTAPVVTCQIKARLEHMRAPRLGDLAALAGRLRGASAQRLCLRQRRALWRWMAGGPARAAHARGAEREAATLIKDAIRTAEIGAGKGPSRWSARGRAVPTVSPCAPCSACRRRT